MILTLEDYIKEKRQIWLQLLFLSRPSVSLFKRTCCSSDKSHIIENKKCFLLTLCFSYYPGIGIKVGLQVFLNRQRTDNMSAFRYRAIASCGDTNKKKEFFEKDNYNRRRIVLTIPRDTITRQRKGMSQTSVTRITIPPEWSSPIRGDRESSWSTGDASTTKSSKAISG
jgi:hypothetical protein